MIIDIDVVFGGLYSPAVRLLCAEVATGISPPLERMESICKEAKHIRS